MDQKTLNILEFNKVLAEVESLCRSFVAQEFARKLRPTNDYKKALQQIIETTEARQFLAESEGNIAGGVFDIREFLVDANRGKILQPTAFQDIKSTLISARDVSRLFSKAADNYPRLAEIAKDIPSVTSIIEKISNIIDEKGDIKDSACATICSDVYPRSGRAFEDVHLAVIRLVAFVDYIISICTHCDIEGRTTWARFRIKGAVVTFTRL